jgi:hypothetical protein
MLLFPTIQVLPAHLPHAALALSQQHYLTLINATLFSYLYLCQHCIVYHVQHCDAVAEPHCMYECESRMHSVLQMCADNLETSPTTRLRFNPTGTCNGSLDPLAKSLLTDAPAVYGCCRGEGSEGQLLWLDEMVATQGEAGSWRITYSVCRAKVGGERESEMYYEAVMLPDGSAPEGFVLAIAASAG